MVALKHYRLVLFPVLFKDYSSLTSNSVAKSNTRYLTAVWRIHKILFDPTVK